MVPGNMLVTEFSNMTFEDAHRQDLDAQDMDAQDLDAQDVDANVPFASAQGNGDPIP